MTLERDGYGRHRPIIVCCDFTGCKERLNTSIANLHHAKLYAHSLGWLMLVENGAHVHVCPEHRLKYGEKKGENNDTPDAQ